MKRIPVIGFVCMVLPWLVACGQPSWDVEFGEFRMTASLSEHDCDPEIAVDEEDFSFSVRLGADLDDGPAWLSLTYDTGVVPGPPRQGTVEDGNMVFVATEQGHSEDCECLVVIHETITFMLHEEPDEPENDDEVDSEPPLEGLPHPDRVISVDGTIRNEIVDETGNCPEPGDGGCSLPCEVVYEMTSE